MTWYMKAEPASDLVVTIGNVMKKYHSDLHDAGVRIDCLIARCEEGDPIIVRGFAALATIRITSARDRAMGMADAIMTIDGEAMPAWSEKRLQAVIDHELTHLEIAVDKKSGRPKEDDNGRPKLRIRKHDREFGWFDDTARRFGNDSVEVSQARSLLFDAKWIQEFLPGFDAAA